MLGAGLIRTVFVKSPKDTGYFALNIDEPEDTKVDDVKETKKDQ
jgi:hypothetical protein